MDGSTGSAGWMVRRALPAGAPSAGSGVALGGGARLTSGAAFAGEGVTSLPPTQSFSQTSKTGCSTPWRPGLAENIQPEKIRCIFPFSTSSTWTKPSVSGVSVWGRVRQTRGVICSVPNCTVSSMATSNVVMRPVILSRPAKTAVGLRISSARAEAASAHRAARTGKKERKNLMIAMEPRSSASQPALHASGDQA